MKRLLLLSFFLFSLSLANAELKVATLHPLITDLAKQVGGNKVTVVGLMKPGADPHAFSPTPGQLASVSNAKLILASGKGMETYLPKMQDNLSAGQRILEVGRRVPSLKISGKDELFVCCPAHSVGGLDPHWWHSPSAMQRATLIVAEEFSKADPANAATYKANADAYRSKLRQLDSWAKKQFSVIPRSKRKLTTSHLAFGYLCRDYGFKALPVQGLTRERNASPSYLAEAISQIKKQKIPAVFPEQLANPKVLKAMVSETGVKLGGTLIADGSVSSWEKMFQHNVSTIVRGLSES
ncbi:MAG: metal ABC transporter substrate-binding protein [Verrucomicrobiota bacterium]